MNCSEFTSNLFAFREGALPEELNNIYRDHLASCSACTRLLSEFSDLEMIIEMEKTAEPNPFATTRILQHIETEFEGPGTSNSPLWSRVLQPVSIAVALLCGILIGSYSSKNEHAPPGQLATKSENIAFLKSNLFISEFADEDKILVLNK